MISESEASLPSADDSIARPLIVAFSLFLVALLSAAIVSGIIIRKLRAPLDYASESAFAVAVLLSDAHDAIDRLDLLLTEADDDARTHANEFVRLALVERRIINQALTDLPTDLGPRMGTAILLEQRDRLFAALDVTLSAESTFWKNSRLATQLSGQSQKTIEEGITATRRHSGDYAGDDTNMSRTLGEFRYYLSSMSSFIASVQSDTNRPGLDNAANLYAQSLRRAVSALSRLPSYDERIELFDNAQILFELGHDEDGFFAVSREALAYEETFELERDAYRAIAHGMRDEIRSVSALNDASTAATLRSARRSLNRYQRLLIGTLLASALIGSLVIKRYVFDAIIARIRSLRDGTQKMADGNFDVKIDASGKDEISDLARALGTFKDVSLARLRSEKNLKQRTAQLEIANKELDEFAYIASHDLRAPLHGIDSLASFVQEDLKEHLPEESDRHLQLMRARIQRLHKLLDSLLEFSRVGRENHPPSWVSLGETIRSSASLMEKPGFDISYDVQDCDVCIATIPFEQVVRNLVDNSIKHHDRDEGNIWLNAKIENSMIALTIEDDGPGIPGKFQDRVFEMFQTLQARDTTEGSGMGLSFLRKSTNHFGGSITLHSDPDTRRGTTFIVHWPIEDHRAA